MAHFYKDAAVELYYNNVKKLETTSTGVSVTGGGTFAGDVTATQYNVSNTSGYLLREDTGSGYGLFKSSTTNIGIASNGNVALNIDSSANATFGGDVTISKAGTPLLQLVDTTNNVSLLLGADDANTFLRSSSGSMFFQTNGGTSALTLDSSQNSTFAGDVNLTAGQLEMRGDVALDHDGSSLYVKAPSSIFLFPANTNKGNINAAGLLTIAGGGNFGGDLTGISATFSSNVNASNANLTGALNINNTLPTIKLTDTDTSAYGRIRSSNGSLTLEADEGNTQADSFIKFEIDADEKMRITSDGNVGIGTDSPAHLLDVNGIADINSIIIGTSGDNIYHNGSDFYIKTETAHSLIFRTSNVNRLKISEAGNVGIGTDSPSKKLEVEGNIRAKVSGGLTAAEIDMTSGATWRLRSNPISGTNSYGLDIVKGGAGTDVKMSIDSSGNVGIGTTSPDRELDVIGVIQAQGFFKSLVSSSSTNLATSNGGLLNLTNSNATDGNFSNVGGYNSNGLVTSQINFINVSHASRTGDISFNTHNGSALTERMRITSGGNVLFGTQGTPNGTSVYGSAFIEGSSDRRYLNFATSSTFNREHIQFFNPNGKVGSILTNGSTTSYNTSSDYRLKEDLKDFAGLDMVSKIPVYDYKWKADESRSYGVMAHELQEVLPDAVSGEKDAEEMQGVDYSKIVPLLVKSIQELKAEIDILKSQNCKCKN